MSAAALLVELDSSGSPWPATICTIRPGLASASHPIAHRFAAHKPALLAELLKARIIAALDVEPANFDRAEYDRLWTCWKVHEAAGETS